MTATKTRRRARAAAVAMFLAVPALASCATNFDAQTDQYYNPTDGTSNRDGSVDVINALIISDQPGSGRLIAALATSDAAAAPVGIGEEGSNAPSATASPENDTLTGVQGVGVDQSVTFTLEGGNTTIPAGGSLQLADKDAAMIAVSGDPERVSAGGFVEVKFTFQNGEPVTLQVPVLAPDDTYAGIELPSASSSESPSATESPSASPSESAKPRTSGKKG